MSIIVSVSEGSKEIMDFLKNEGYEMLVFDTLRNRLYEKNEIQDQEYSARWLEYHYTKQDNKRPSEVLLDILEGNPAVMKFSLTRE